MLIQKDPESSSGGQFLFCHAEFVSASYIICLLYQSKKTLNQVQGDSFLFCHTELVSASYNSISNNQINNTLPLRLEREYKILVCFKFSLSF